MYLQISLWAAIYLIAIMYDRIRSATCEPSNFNSGNDHELTASEFFDPNMPDPFFNPKTSTVPTLDEMAKLFFDVEEEEAFFHDNKDLFEKIDGSEKFFFKEEEKPKLIPSKTCHCSALHCVCCRALKIGNFKKYTGCLSMEYNQVDFCIVINLTLNGKQLVTKIISGRNPVPFCTSGSIIIPFVRFCLRLYDLRHNPNGISMCFRLEAVSMGRILLSVSFDCLKIENNKLSFMQPTTAMTFGFLRVHLGDTDPYISYQDFTKLHIPLPPLTIEPVTTVKPKRFWFFK
uniref:DUF4773 domain-containing protein n=1 Tax=Clastoptera arizonana TaxID=38151 RepID=A0A1B6DEP2_9HEMI